MATSLASDTRAAFDQARRALTQIELDLVRRARMTANKPTGERDRLLESVVLAYRSGDRQSWGGVLLDLLTPALLKRLGLFRPEPPVIDAEDLRAEFVLQLLEAAATMPFPPALPFLSGGWSCAPARACAGGWARSGAGAPLVNQ